MRLVGSSAEHAHLMSIFLLLSIDVSHFINADISASASLTVSDISGTLNQTLIGAQCSTSYCNCSFQTTNKYKHNLQLCIDRPLQWGCLLGSSECWSFDAIDGLSPLLDLLALADKKWRDLLLHGSSWQHLCSAVQKYAYDTSCQATDMLLRMPRQHDHPCNSCCTHTRDKTWAVDPGSWLNRRQ